LTDDDCGIRIINYVSQVVRFLIPRIQIPTFTVYVKRFVSLFEGERDTYWNIVRYDTICIWEYERGERFLVGALSESRGEAKENDGICGNATRGRTKTQIRHDFEKKIW